MKRLCSTLLVCLAVSLYCTAQSADWQLLVTAKEVNEDVHLQWAFNPQAANDSFIIERSIDGALFKEIAGIAAATLQKYIYVDTHPVKGINYYRIRQRDISGQYSFSNVAKVLTVISTCMQVYPNPTAAEINIINIKPGEHLQLCDHAGKIILTQEATIATSIDLTELPQGVYFLRRKLVNEQLKIVKN